MARSSFVLRGLCGLTMVFALSVSTSAQSLQFVLSRTAIACIAENASAYEAAKVYDFTVIRPAECPDVPDVSEGPVSNEFVNVPDRDPNAQPEAILVPVRMLPCLQKIATETEEVEAEALISIDLEACTFAR